MNSEYQNPVDSRIQVYTQEEAADYDRRFKEKYGLSFMDHIEMELERIFSPDTKGGKE